MKLWHKLIVAGSVALFSAGAVADKTHGNRYVGVAVGFLEAEGDPSDSSLTHFEGRIGGYLNEFVALEGRAGTGVTGDDVAGVDVDLRYLLGLYARIGAMLNEDVFPYIMVGFSRADIESDFNGTTANVAETDASFGIGIDANLANLSLFAEYAQYAEVDGADLSGFTVGLKSTF